MRPLFTSFACDWCDGLVEREPVSGFIVLREPAQLGRSPIYVFRTRTDAAIWRSAQGLQSRPILEVLTEAEITWRRSSGTIEGIELADRPFTIYRDHRYPPGPYKAYLAPAARDVAA